jgi:hypothetical protein
MKKRFNHKSKVEVMTESDTLFHEQESKLVITECLQNLEQIKTDFERNKVNSRSIRKKDAALTQTIINKLQSLGE